MFLFERNGTGRKCHHFYAFYCSHAKKFILPNSMGSLCLLVAQVPRFKSAGSGDFCAHNDDTSVDPCSCMLSNYQIIID